jgi:DDE superfamily endonuclease
VRTTKPKAAAAARIGAALARRKRAELLELLRPCFARTQTWLQAGKYAAAVMSQIPRRNGWTIAAQAGDQAPDKIQRLLSRAVWDTFAVMGVVRRFAVAGLDEAAARAGRWRGLAVGALDETGQVKAGQLTAGVKRQYLGCAGKVANGINTVHLAYVREGTVHALIGAREWIPAAQISDPVRSQVMGLPGDLAFRTKGQLAIDILTDAFADGVLLDFVCGDEVYGWCTGLREFCEDHDQAYVLRVPSSFRLALSGGITLTCQQAAARLGPSRGWTVSGSTSPRSASTPRSPGTPSWSWPPGHLRRHRRPAPFPHRHPGTRPRAPRPAPPAEFGMIPLTVPETGRLLTRPPPPGTAAHWLGWRRCHQARSRWYHQRTRLARHAELTLVS